MSPSTALITAGIISGLGLILGSLAPDIVSLVLALTMACKFFYREMLTNIGLVRIVVASLK